MKRYALKIGSAIPFIEAILDKFCGDSLLSMEGDLSQLPAHLLFNTISDETSVLRRNTTAPREDFIVVPLSNQNVDTLKERILPTIGIRSRITHIQIEKENELVFGAYDQLHPECVFVTADVGQGFLNSLINEGALNGYYLINQ